MLAEPEVAPWWGEWDVMRVERELIADEEEVWLAIEVARRAGRDRRLVGGGRPAVPLGGDRHLAAQRLPRAAPRARTPWRRCPLAVRRGRPSPGHDRPRRRQRPRDPLLRERRLPAGRRDAPLRAPRERRVPRWAADGPASGRAARARREHGPRRPVLASLQGHAVDRRAAARKRPRRGPWRGLARDRPQRRPQHLRPRRTVLARYVPGVTLDGGYSLADRIHHSGQAMVWCGHREPAELYWEQLCDSGLTMAPLEQG